jgi:hypothetical protein
MLGVLLCIAVPSAKHQQEHHELIQQDNDGDDAGPPPAPMIDYNRPSVALVDGANVVCVSLLLTCSLAHLP